MHTVDPVALAAELISIDSVNPSLVPGAAGEAAIAEFCATWLAARGFEVTRVGSADRPSIVAVKRGSGGRSLMLNAHLDTVAATREQLAPVVRDGKLVGRGAFDTKGGVAALMTAAAAAECSGDIIVTLVADEEFGSRGTEEVLAAFTADAAIVVEPSELELTVAHRGFAWFEVTITGRAAHGSMPAQGIDAIAHARRVMDALDFLESELEAAAAHPLLGRGTVRVATITGGVDAATVAPSATLTIERRFLPGESPDFVEQQLRLALLPLLDRPDSATVSDNTASATLTRLVARGAFEADPTSPIVDIVARATADVTGSAVRRGEPFWTDAGLVVGAGIPCLVIGVAGGGAHADVEWATTESMTQLTEVLRRSIEEFCG